MKVKGIDGKVYNMMLTGHVPLGNEQRERSKYHLMARDLLTKSFPSDRILEEVFLPGSGGLTTDFFIPAENTMVEVHGQQHYEYVQYFHQNILGFISSKRRDINKRKWCEINNIRLIEFSYAETIDEWRNKLRR